MVGEMGGPAMLPAGVELRPSLQLSERLLAVGFPGENVPDPFATGVMVENLRGVVARMDQRPGANALVVDLRNVPEITGAGVYALKSLRTSLRDRKVNGILVVRGGPEREWLDGTGVTDHMRVVIGEEGLQAWLAQMAEDEVTFSEENIRKMIAEDRTLDGILERLSKARARQ